MNYATPRLSLPGIQPPHRDPKQSEDRLESGPQNLCSSVSTCGCLEFLRLRPCFLALSALIFAFFFVPQADAADFYVATDGSDSNPGTIDQPFATLNGARTAIRALSHPLSSSVTVWIRGGRYYLQSAFALSGSRDSGTPTAPVVYQNYPDETPYIIGGVVVTNFQAVTDPTILARLTTPAQANALVADLAAQAITNLGVMTNHGYGHHDYDQAEKPFQSELLFQDQSMQLARWPNALTTNPRTNWLRIASSLTTNSFTYGSVTNPTVWAEVTNAWVQGFWGYDYADSWERVTAIATNNVGGVWSNTVSLNWPGAYGSQYNNPNSYKKGQRFFFFNILEELDSPGEYYIDRTNGKLYFWPPTTITDGSCIVSITTNIVTLTSVSNITFSGITFEAGKSALLQISGGQSNLVTYCNLQGGSADGIKILNSVGTGVSSCSLFDLGERGVWIYGSGDRANLIPGGNFVTYNTLYDVSRLCIGNKNAIDTMHTYYMVPQNVVGIYIAHNLMRDMPHQAITLFGNNNLIEYNEIYNVCNETADAGAIYAGANPTFRGNVIRYNYIHDIHMGAGASDYSGVFGIYADAAWSGTIMLGNIIRNVDHGIFVNGGSDNTIQNNIFVDITNSIPAKLAPFSVYVNQSALYNGFTNTTGTYWNRLTNIPYQNALWSNAYPTLATITNGPSSAPNINFCYATNNVIAANISYNNTTWIKWSDNANTNATVTNNFTNGDPLFVDYAHRNFGLLTDSPVWDLGFQSLPTTGFGPRLLPASGLQNARPR